LIDMKATDHPRPEVEYDKSHVTKPAASSVNVPYMASVFVSEVGHFHFLRVIGSA
jgi:hypothetical protein